MMEGFFEQMDFSGDQALYLQLMDQIIVGIATAQLRDGESLPSVRQLADVIGINMHTVNKAYDLLRRQGFLVIDRRHGAVVRVNRDKTDAIKELEDGLSMALARSCCRELSRDEVHQLVDEIYNIYEE